MKAVPTSVLTSVVTTAFERAGAPTATARRVAQGLVSADVAGVDTHGVISAPRYIAAIQAGELDPGASPACLADEGPTGLVSGHWGFGHIAADFATRLAVEKAHQYGVAAVGLVESHHLGRLGEFAENAARSGVVLLIFGGGQGEELPSAVPYGGSRPVLHTNPVAVGIPGEPERPMIVDIATTVVSGGKVDRARTRGEQLPPGVIVDRNGRPTTDPAAFFDGGALLPFGGHKGYAIMLTTEILGRILTGADQYVSGALGGPVLRHSGYLFIALRLDAFAPAGFVAERIEDLLGRVRTVPPASGFDAVLVPGDVEAANRRDHSVSLSVDEGTLGRLLDLAGLTLAQLDYGEDL